MTRNQMIDAIVDHHLEPLDGADAKAELESLWRHGLVYKPFCDMTDAEVLAEYRATCEVDA